MNNEDMKSFLKLVLAEGLTRVADHEMNIFRN